MPADSDSWGRFEADLDRFTPIDDAEQKHLEAIRDLVARFPVCASRSHFAPGHLTGSAFIVDIASRRLLLHHHRRLGRWLQMGGHLDAGETPVTAARREGTEESGLSPLRSLHDGIFDLDVHTIPAARGEPEHRHFDVRYLFAADGTQALALDGNESLDLAWFSLEESVERLAEAGARRVIGKIARVFG